MQEENKLSTLKYNLLSNVVSKTIEDLEKHYGGAILFRKVFSNCRLPIALVSKDNVFLWINNAFCDMLGYTIEEMLGHTWMEFTVESFIEEDLQFVKDKQPYLLPKKYIHKDGREIPVYLSVNQVDTKEDDYYHVSIVYEFLVLQEAQWKVGGAN